MPAHHVAAAPRPDAAPPAAVGAGAPFDAGFEDEDAVPRRRSRWWLGAIAVGAVVAFGAGWFGLQQLRADDASVPSQTAEPHSAEPVVTPPTASAPTPEPAPPPSGSAVQPAPAATPSETIAAPAEPAPSAEPADARQPFREEHLRQELLAAVKDPDSCRAEGQPTGWVYLSLVISPDVEAIFGIRGVLITATTHSSA